MWVLDCLDDICSDLSAFHHVTDARELEGPVFFRLAQRLPFYDGAVRAHMAGAVRRAAAASQQDAAPAAVPEPAAPRRLPPVTGAVMEEINRTHGQRWFSYTRVPKAVPEGGA